jgi:hypothetical protein
MTIDDLVTELRLTAERAQAGIARIEAANLAQGLPANSSVIRGEVAIAAALDVQEANRRQGEIIAQLLKT